MDLGAAVPHHLRFPGLFGECWIYGNGELCEHRDQGTIRWLNDDRFEWDGGLAGKLPPGATTITLRCKWEHHVRGLFRRPFLYREVDR